MSSVDHSAERDPLDVLAEEFVARHRRGEQPALAEYVERYPELAGPIQELFPALLLMEQVKPPEGKLAVNQPGGELPQPSLPFPMGRLGDFRILRVLGRGGMGVVYEAIQESLGRHVALKVLPPHGRLDATQLGRFRREARAAAGLHHTNIVPVFAVGEQDGVPYYAMQFIRGQGIDTILDELRRLRHDGVATRDKPPPGTNRVENAGPCNVDSDAITAAITQGLLSGRFAVLARQEPDPQISLMTAMIDPTATTRAGGIGIEEITAPLLPERSGLISQPGATYFRTIARIGAQTADALAYAHAQGICHRDIKPSNLLLDACGIVWVADFGLAKAENGAGEGLTQTGDIVGTLRYMAPERFNGWADARSDVYALGVTLYEMLTLRPAFVESDRLKLIDRIANGAVPRPRSIDPRIPSDLETIVLKAMARDAGERYISARALAEDLERFLADRTILARRSSVRERAWRWCRRNPLVATLTSLAAALTVLVAIVSTWSAYRNGRLAAQLVVRNAEANRNLVQAYATEAEALRQSRRAGQRFEALGAVEKAMRLSATAGITETQRFRLRNAAIGAMALPDLRVALELDVPHAKDNGFAVDPAFERYAFRLADGTIIVRRLADGAELHRLHGLPPAKEASQAGFSPDGRYLAMTSGVARRPPGLGPARESPRTDRARDELVDSNKLELPAQRPRAGPRPYRRLARLLRAAKWAFAPAPDSVPRRRESRGLQPGRIPTRCLEPRPQNNQGRQQRFGPAPGHAVASGIIVPGHLESAPAEYPGRFLRRLRDLSVGCGHGPPERGPPGDSYNGLFIAFHPGGKLLASRGWHSMLRLWDTRTGQQLLSRPSLWSSTFEFDRSGRWLSVAPTLEKVQILEVADSAECRTLVDEPFRDDNRHGRVAVDPSGHRLLTAGPHVLVWDLPTGRTLAELPPAAVGRHILFDPSGAILTNAPSLLRWPIREAPDGATTIGPPQMLRRPGTRNAFAISQDGGTIAAAMNDEGGLVFDVRDPRRARWLRQHRNVCDIVISPDGHWVVTGSRNDNDGMKLWDAQTGRLVHDFPGVPEEAYRVWSFSPDGRWLAVCWDGWVLFETKTWTPRLRLFRGPTFGLAFAPDSRTTVYDDYAGTIVLVDVESGRELARLEDAEQAQIDTTAFTPDGSQLVTTLVGRPYLASGTCGRFADVSPTCSLIGRHRPSTPRPTRRLLSHRCPGHFGSITASSIPG